MYLLEGRGYQVAAEGRASASGEAGRSAEGGAATGRTVHLARGPMCCPYVPVPGATRGQWPAGERAGRGGEPEPREPMLGVLWRGGSAFLGAFWALQNA